MHRVQQFRNTEHTERVRAVVKKYESIEAVLVDRLSRLGPEDLPTQDLVKRMAHAAKTHRLDMKLLGEIWDWKNAGTQFAAYTRRSFEQNEDAQIAQVWRRVLAEPNDMVRMRLLDTLSGLVFRLPRPC
jgi:hypothetical protein